MATTRLTALAETQSTLIVAPLVGTPHPWAAVLPSFTRACVEVLVEALATPPADASATLMVAAEAGSEPSIATARRPVIGTRRMTPPLEKFTYATVWLRRPISARVPSTSQPERLTGSWPWLNR